MKLSPFSPKLVVLFFKDKHATSLLFPLDFFGGFLDSYKPFGSRWMTGSLEINSPRVLHSHSSPYGSCVLDSEAGSGGMVRLRKDLPCVK